MTQCSDRLESINQRQERETQMNDSGLYEIEEDTSLLLSDEGEITTIGIFFWAATIALALGGLWALFSGALTELAGDIDTTIRGLF